MVCIYCGHRRTKVINSRPQAQAASVWRRRQCLLCQRIVSTYEVVASDYLPLVNYPDQPPKTINIFRLATSFNHHLDNSDSDNAYHLASTVVQKIIAGGHSEVNLDQLISASYETLVAFDKSAGAQYGIRHKAIDY